MIGQNQDSKNKIDLNFWKQFSLIDIIAYPLLIFGLHWLALAQ
jgi:hypothetical protein